MKTQDRTKHEDSTLIKHHKEFIIEEKEEKIDSAIIAQLHNII